MRTHKYMPPTEMTNNSLKRLFNKHNRSSQLTLSLASLSLLLLLVGTFTLPFNQGLFSKLYTKPASHADTMMMGPQHIGCTFLSDPNAQPAFCDTFQTPAPGGRGGDLDESIWGYSRNTGDTNGGQGLFNWEAPTYAQFCKTRIAGVLPPDESFFCGTQFNEANHWMETFEDSGNFFWVDAMARQPFDFTNRTGTITFESDIKTNGGHFNWIQLTVSDQPVPGPTSTNISPKGPNPRNGIVIIFGDNCGSPGQLAEVSSVDVYKDYALTNHLVKYNGLSNVQCVTTHADMSNHIEVRLSQNDLAIYSTDDDQTNFREIASATNLGLPFSQGYVHFQHVDYNPEKYGSTGDLTYHWHNLGFDGPILALQRGYSIPDSLQPKNGGVNLGYEVKPTGTFLASTATPLAPFTIPNVNLSNATGAFLSLNAIYISTGTILQYRLNGGTWHDYTIPPDEVGTIGWGTTIPIYIPVALSELVSGNNSLEFKETTPSTAPNAQYVSDLPIQNIDLTIQTSVIPSPPPPVYMFSPLPSVAPFPTPKFNVTTSTTPGSVVIGGPISLTTTVTNTTASPITGKVVITVVGPSDMELANVVVDNNSNMTFQPNSPMTHTISIPLGVPEDTSSQSADEWGYVGTYHVIESIYSSDGSTIYFNNENISSFNVTTPSGSPAPCLGNCPAYSTYYTDLTASSSPTPSPMMSMSPNPSMTPMPSSTTGTLPGDFNGDSHVNLTDLSIFSTSFGTSSPNIPTPSCDLNSDGKVNLTDLSILASHYGN